MHKLHYITQTDFERVLNSDLSTKDKAAILAGLARINALYAIRKAGSGHIGSSFSSLDIVSSIMLGWVLPSKGSDLYFSSKGHDAPGLYALMSGVGLLPFELIHQLRALDGLPGHPDINTPGICANTGSLGMGISKAKGMCLAARLQGLRRRVFVLTGDGELQEGQIWESAASTANAGLSEITVIVDHNKLQSDTFVEKVSPLGDLASKFKSFGWHVSRVDGHDVSDIFAALNKAVDQDSAPSVIIAETIKGKGVEEFEHTAMPPGDEFYQFHSGAPDWPVYEQAAEELLKLSNALLTDHGLAPCQPELDQIQPAAAPPAQQNLISAYGEALVAQAKQHDNLVVLDADLIKDCGLVAFRDTYPERFFECGIAEQDMVSTAGGMALSGLLPVVHSFACFLTTRPNEHIYNNASEKTKLVYVGSLAGVLPGGPGHSHQSVRDINLMSAIPGMLCLEPSCAAEVGAALDFLLNKWEGPGYLRLMTPPWPVDFSLPADHQLRLGIGATLRPGRGAAIITYGPVMLGEALKAASLLAAGGIECAVYNLPWLNRLDEAWLAGIFKDASLLVTLDNHYIRGGQGQMIAAAVARLRDPIPALLHLGLKDLPCCGSNDEVLAAHGLDAASIAQAVKKASTDLQ
jgi:transketolase